MNKREFIDTINFFSSKYKTVIKLIIMLALLIPFALGYSISANFVNRELCENEYQLCELVAKNVYEQGNNATLLDIPTGFSVIKTPTSITVRLDGCCGKVVAKCHNGELLIIRNPEIFERFALNVFGGLIFILIACIPRLLIKQFTFEDD